MKIITESDKLTINKLYVQLKTYAAVSRATGFSPNTVKKYIDPNYVSSIPQPPKPVLKRFDEELPRPDYSIFMQSSWNKLCEVSFNEIMEIKKLWKELEM